MTTHLLIYILYTCHKCPSSSKTYNKPFNLRRHLVSSAHSLMLPSRQPVKGNYFCEDGNRKLVIVDDNVDGALEYYGCPSCWLVLPEREKIIEHITDAHEPLYNNDVAISTKKDVFHFRRTAASPQPKRPKITDKSIATLLPVLSVIADQQAIDQVNLVALKQYPTAHSLLVKAMDVTLPLLPRFLWTFVNDTSTKNDDATFVKVIQCVLTDFYSKCHRNPHYQPKYERTFWVDRVVPIFQCLGDHSQLLGFQWCEIPTEEHAEFTIDPTTWKRSIPNKFHDGLGYDSNNRSRLIMEGSSRYTDKENVQHSQDDTIKSIHTSIELLDSIIRRHLYASFASLCLIKSFSVQCVCTSVNLSTTYLDPEDAGAYIHAQVRSAEIPINYNSRASWAAIFELLAYLFSSLREQEMVLETVTKESAGLSHIADSDRGVNVLLQMIELL